MYKYINSGINATSYVNMKSNKLSSNTNKLMKQAIPMIQMNKNKFPPIM